MVLSVCAVFAAPSTDLGGVVPSGATFVTPGPNGFLDVLYQTKAFDSSFINGYATSPSYGWITVDDFVLDEDSNIEKITYWVINYQAMSGYRHRFWGLSGQKPGTELTEASGPVCTLTSTGQYAFGYLVYKAEAAMDYDIVSGHYFSGSYFASGFWYMMVFTNAYDYLACFDYGGGGSGPWYTSMEMWGESSDMFQIIEGTAGEPEYDPPYVTDMDPDDGEVQVPLDSNIVFHCVDAEHPVDTDTIDYTATDTSLSTGRVVGLGSPNRVIDGDLDIDDADPMDVVCTFDPTDDFYEGDTITNTVAAGLADSKGNEMVDDFVWTFDTWSGVETTTWGAIKADF
ncbi:MAG: hypothetical protein A2Y64_03155 [Candidatus Coatesbacteria bacterium RBG_13_66_14]|uniref:SbsA Ig-like domain-containing protein n=1 Tax=Candidatus Coatesbacteria bacterium RBG_13_66_14 TaxID=1817816 RepID=A0A1F5EYQ0_9BACT|nr:MAG: hypothetical protein A2Y64_03155 [Candidatus Coatesbacteria bacterium RBG_13_66_14]